MLPATSGTNTRVRQSRFSAKGQSASWLFVVSFVRHLRSDSYRPSRRKWVKGIWGLSSVIYKVNIPRVVQRVHHQVALTTSRKIAESHFQLSLSSLSPTSAQRRLFTGQSHISTEAADGSRGFGKMGCRVEIGERGYRPCVRQRESHKGKSHFH